MSSRPSARGTTPSVATTDAPPRPARQAVAIVAAVVALVSVASLLAVLLLTMADAHPWTGLSWIAMLGLPAAVVLGVVLMVDAVRSRRITAGRRGRP
ncbi:hypothetical protein V6N00_12260 [Tersicoccus sp. MR15.9]|uniref:hypothetical protein n=1 Tax=Tersicoccus mangrovi TaxID=3121635 RepID=UPI002FE56D82